MKSMKQMQSEILAKARWDGGYPKALHMGFGVIALAHSADEEASLHRGNLRATIIGVVLGVVLGIAVIGWVAHR